VQTATYAALLHGFLLYQSFCFRLSLGIALCQRSPRTGLSFDRIFTRDQSRNAVISWRLPRTQNTQHTTTISSASGVIFFYTKLTFFPCNNSNSTIRTLLNPAVHTLTLWCPQLPYMGTAIKHPVPDWVKTSLIIFDIRALWHSVKSWLNQSIHKQYILQSVADHTSFQYRIMKDLRLKWTDFYMH